MAEVSININELNSILGDTADFVNSAAPKLEKLSSFENDLEKYSSIIVDRLVTGKFIDAEQAKQAATEIRESGIKKLAEVVQFVINESEKRAAEVVVPMGKAASDSKTTDKPMSADDAFLSRLGLPTSR